tara:strand:+ start:379 stop:783 length:405 start_codon:yes stop_codon:yes gene_type:complete
MLELLHTAWDLVLGLLILLWGIVSLILASGVDLLVVLHTEMPRLEGLLVGVALSWLLLRRNKHPLLRVLSAPLKLILDILDLAWDQVVEIVSDVWSVCTGWVRSSVGWVWSRVSGLASKVMSGLSGLRDKLSSK